MKQKLIFSCQCIVDFSDALLEEQKYTTTQKNLPFEHRNLNRISILSIWLVIF